MSTIASSAAVTCEIKQFLRVATVLLYMEPWLYVAVSLFVKRCDYVCCSQLFQLISTSIDCVTMQRCKETTGHGLVTFFLLLPLFHAYYTTFSFRREIAAHCAQATKINVDIDFNNKTKIC